MTTDIAAQRDALRAEVAAEEARIAAMVQSGAPHCFIQRVRAYASDLRIRQAGLALMLEILAERAVFSSQRRGAENDAQSRRTAPSVNMIAKASGHGSAACASAQRGRLQPERPNV